MQEEKESLFTAIRTGNIAEVKKLVKGMPTSVNLPNDRGFSPIIMAAYFDQLEIVSFLLENNADIDSKDTSGNTAIMGSSFKGYEAIVRKLIEKGADLNCRNNMGATALIYAASFGHLEIARLLLAAGADTSVRDQKGYTAYENAKLKGAPALINILKEA